MIAKLLALLTPPERRSAGLLMGMILVMAFLDMLGVASILPFMSVLANPELAQTNVVLNTAFTISRHIGIHTPEQFLFALGVLVFVLLHSISSYPTPMDQANLRQLAEFGRRFDVVPGLSDHTLGTTASVAAVALGACVIESISR